MLTSSISQSKIEHANGRKRRTNAKKKKTKHFLILSVHWLLLVKFLVMLSVCLGDSFFSLALSLSLTLFNYFTFSHLIPKFRFLTLCAIFFRVGWWLLSLKKKTPRNIEATCTRGTGSNHTTFTEFRSHRNTNRNNKNKEKKISVQNGRENCFLLLLVCSTPKPNIYQFIFLFFFFLKCGHTD